MAATRSNIVALAKSQRGTHETSNRVKYASWYASMFGAGWASALWCAIFICWLFDQKGSIKLIGGYTASTVTLLHRLPATCTRVSFNDARSGDILLSRFGSAGGGRANNPVNHVDLVVGPAKSGRIPVIGGNTPQPGVPGDPSNGRGVWSHYRYPSTTVAIFRPRYATSRPTEVLKRGSRGKAVARLQRMLGVKADKIFGVNTDKATKAMQRRLKAYGSYRGAVDGVWGPKSEAAYQDFIDGVIGRNTWKLWHTNAGLKPHGKATKPLIRKVQKTSAHRSAVQPRHRITGDDIDGIDGPQFWRMIQDLVGFTGKAIDGIPGVRTGKALQRRLLRGRW